MKEDINKLKRAVIAGASKALTVKEKNPRLTDSEVMREVTRDINNIVDKID